jgi:uncharacterized membrane protein YeaQ/YmgE (transglycosylase-associated protein family)
MVTGGMRLTALTIAVVDLAGIACLIAFSLVSGPFGTLNDIANGVVGALSTLLALQMYARSEPDRLRVAPAASILGGVIMIIGSALVIVGIADWYLAGLVSSLGAAFIGLWLFTADRRRGGLLQLLRHTRLLGRISGIVMMFGVLAMPGILAGVDDWEASPWYVTASQVSWLGTYLLYPLWCLLLARARRPARVSPRRMYGPTRPRRSAPSKSARAPREQG